MMARAAWVVIAVLAVGAFLVWQLDRLFKRLFPRASFAIGQGEARYQFERHGYFISDRIDHTADAPVFNRITTLRDSWAA